MPRWVWLCGATAFVAIVVASLIPAKLQLRSRGGSLMVSAALREALQGLTPDRVPDLPTALSGAAGALLLAKLVMEARKGPRIGQQPGLQA
jgi:hypothetical protein